MNKKTIRDLTDAELRGKRALVRVDFNVPLDRRSRHRRHAHSRRAADDRGAARRAARASCCSRTSAARRASRSRSIRSSRSPAHLAELLPATHGELRRDDRQRRGACKATHERKPGTVLLLENTRFLGGEEKNEERLSRGLARARRSLRQRRVRLGAPRARVDRRRRALSQARRRRAADGEGARVSRRCAREPAAAVRRDPRRRQDLGQDRRHRAAAAQGRQADHRRRDGVHVLQGDGPRDGQVARRGGSRRDGEGAARARRRQAGAADATRWSRRRWRRRRGDARLRATAIPAIEAMFDIGPESRRSVRGRDRSAQRR